MLHKSQLDLQALTWSVSHLGEALEALALRSKFLPRPMEVPNPPPALTQASNEVLGQWLELTASHLDLEVEPVETSYSAVEDFVRAAGPAILRLPPTAEWPQARFLALLKGGRSHLTLLGPALNSQRVASALVVQALSADLEAPLLATIADLFAKVEIPLHRRQRAQKALLHQLLSAERLEGFWLIRLAPGAYLWGHIQQLGLLGYLTRLLTLMGIYQVLDVAAWWVIGKGALQGSFDWAFLWAWVLLLFSILPFHLWRVWTENLFSTYAGAFFKQRLLAGILKLNPDELRSQGVGQFLSRVMDSEAFEMLALTGGFSFIRGFVETTAAFLILSQGANGNLLSLLLGGWVFLTLLLCWPYLSSKKAWTQAFREMTNDLVERMSGHRTRLAQEDQAHWHDAEDQQVAQNLKLSELVDRVALQLQAVMPQGWLSIGMAGIAPSLVFASATAEELAFSLGGIFLASQALNNLITGAQSIVKLLVAWDQIAPLNQAATRPPEGAQGINLAPNYGQGPEAAKLAVLVARDLAFRYAQRPQPVLQGCRLQIQKGDRLLLEGPSGGGKSTLAALLTGLRTPQAGLLLLWGFDQQTLGREEWQRRVVSAPQFHENHVFTETFAFNLLMGRQWPPSKEDLAEAETICQELRLGDLLKRMPAGLQQMVGESGWQLSHGERSRLFIARALLQKADLIVLDESFAALDPENLQLALQCVLERAPTLLVIAHP